MSELSRREREVLADLDRWWADHLDEFVADLVAWVRVPSVSRSDQAAPGAPFGPDVAAIFDLVRSRAADLGFRAVDHEGFALSVIGDPQGPEPQGPAEQGSESALGLGEQGQKQQEPEGSELGLVSHLDVVAAGRGWTLPPFEATVRDGFVVGRGTADNKGAALVDLYLLRFLRDARIGLEHPIRVVYGGAEEVDMADLRHYAETAPLPVLSLITDGPFPVNHAQKGGLDIDITTGVGSTLAGLSVGTHRAEVPAVASIDLDAAALGAAADPATRAPDSADMDARVSASTGVPKLKQPPRGRLEIVAGAAGSSLVAYGVGGHSAFPETGILNAIGVLAAGLLDNGLVRGADLAAANMLATVLADCYGSRLGVARSDDDSGPLTYNGGIVRSDGRVLRLELAVRYPVTADIDEVIADFVTALEPFGATVTARPSRPPVHVSRADPRVQLLQAAFRDVTGLDVPPIAMGGGTHARVLPRSITFGPGLTFARQAAGLSPGRRPDFIPADHGLTHGPDEFVDLADLHQAFRVWVTALQRLDDFLESKSSFTRETNGETNKA
jgi:succinyl-diaminopimelate desuccinylase